MTIEEGLFSYLSTYAGLTSLVSTKIYPNVKPPQVALPVIVFQKISDDRPSGPVSGHYGLQIDVYQLSVYATTKAAVSAITQLINTALLNLSGSMGGFVIQLALHEAENDGYDDTVSEFYNHIEYKFFYNY